MPVTSSDSRWFNPEFPSPPTYLPDPQRALDMAPEELAGYVLLQALTTYERSGARNPPEGFEFIEAVEWYKIKDRELGLAIAEAWAWLIREGLLIPWRPPMLQTTDTFAVVPSRTARGVNTIQAFQRLRAQRLLPRDLVHPLLKLDGVESAYFEGRYNSAVETALRRVEVIVREAAQASALAYGNGLMRSAFAPGGGALSDSSAPPSEQQGMSDLFAGAIAVFRNPAAHRDVAWSPDETVEILVFASHLLRIVARRDPRSGRAVHALPTTPPADRTVSP